MRISDWSSDVCSSDLLRVGHRAVVVGDADAAHSVKQVIGFDGAADLPRVPRRLQQARERGREARGEVRGERLEGDRKSGVEGKSESVSVGVGGGRSIKKKRQGGGDGRRRSEIR